MRNHRQPERNSFRQKSSRHFEWRSEEHTSELQSLRHLVCRLLLVKKEDDDELRGERADEALQLRQPEGAADHSRERQNAVGHYYADRTVGSGRGLHHTDMMANATP